MTTLARAAAVVAAAATFSMMPAFERAAAQTASPAIVLPDCLGKPQIKPAQIVFACGDGNFSAAKLQWTGWGATFAAARGTGSMNDCTPNCAAGHFHSAPIVVLASGRGSCPDGRPAYTTVTWAWIGKPPYVDNDPKQTFHCKPPL
jgi:hypothetical protein